MEKSLFSSFMAILFLLQKIFYQFVKWDHLKLEHLEKYDNILLDICVKFIP